MGIGEGRRVWSTNATNTLYFSVNVNIVNSIDIKDKIDCI
jgi:hypothetical protein